MQFKNLLTGDPAPFFSQRSSANPKFHFDTAAGRYIVLCFLVTAGDEQGRRALEVLDSHRRLFDDERVSFFGISHDPRDESEGRLQQQLPGIRYFWDFDGSIGRLYGSLPTEIQDMRNIPARRFWLVLDPALRVIASIGFREDGSDRKELIDTLEGLPAPGVIADREIQAPVLLLPGVFEPEFCQRLIELYEANGGVESGFMREVNGKTVGVMDHAHKRRCDYTIVDPELIRAAQSRFMRRVVPMIERCYQFKVTRMERYIVGCYDGASGGHFRAHRDNTTKGTAHRRFAVSVNLNADFDGGEVSFPEFGPRSFKAPPGGAVVFSCSLLHVVSPVTRGRRYAFLPFLYDEAAAAIRAENNKFLGEGVASYESGVA